MLFISLYVELHIYFIVEASCTLQLPSEITTGFIDQSMKSQLMNANLVQSLLALLSGFGEKLLQRTKLSGYNTRQGKIFAIIPWSIRLYARVEVQSRQRCYGILYVIVVQLYVVRCSLVSKSIQVQKQWQVCDRSYVYVFLQNCTIG